ncbi:hypothetical protein F2P79_010131 [Pimephales promelas]|nr:hypothetical protein F2P79_010131 [Pimephales promelas]
MVPENRGGARQPENRGMEPNRTEGMEGRDGDESHEAQTEKHHYIDSATETSNSFWDCELRSGTKQPQAGDTILNKRSSSFPVML